MKKADNFDAGKWLVENKITTQSRLNEEYSSERINQRDVETASGDVINHTFDTIDMIDLDNGYKVKITTTYYFRDPGVKGYTSTASDENPMLSGVKTTLMDSSGKPIKNHNFTGSGQWWMLQGGKEYFMPQIKAWWEDKMGKLGLNEEETQNGTTYLTIKEPLTKAMEAMGYEKPPLESDNFATAYSSLSYVKPLSDTETLEVEVRPAPEKGKVANKEFGSDFEEEGKTDYPVITFEMYVLKTEEQEDKKFFGLVKKKYQDQSYDYIVRPTYLDLSKNTTEGAVSKITSLVKQKEPK
jgi:hypothetical protein